jgi:cysteine desulfurase
MNKPLIYLDYAAATPVDERVLDAAQPYFSEKFYNPSATYLAAQSVSHDLNNARASIAHWLGARSSEIIFTAGGTEANNLAIHGVMRKFPDANIVVSAIEHESILQPAHIYHCHEVAVNETGMLRLEDLSAKIDDKTVLVSIMYANNEVGTIQPLGDIARILDEIRAERRKSGNDLPLYFHTDACQAANYLDLHAARLGVDLMTVNGGKIYGFKQSGVLFVKGGIELRSLIQGGGQERGLRNGTENIAAAVGLATALNIVQQSRQDEVHRLQGLQNYFFEQLAKKVPQAIINGSRKKRLPNNVHLTLQSQDNERLLMQLDEAGVLAAAGSACSASNEEPSHVLRAMGCTDAEARASLRFSMGRSTMRGEITQVITTLSVLLQG